MPNDVDLVKVLASGKAYRWPTVAVLMLFAEGLQLTTSETAAPKAPTTKKKGKRSSAKHRQSKWTNTHLRGEIDLSHDYAPPAAGAK